MRSTCSSERGKVRPALRVGRTRRADSGMATAELAMALPALVAVVSLLLTVVHAASDASRVADAARSGARSASIGVSPELMQERVLALAPEGAGVDVVVDGSWVRVVVSAPPRRWGPLPLPQPVVTASAVLEPGVVP